MTDDYVAVPLEDILSDWGSENVKTLLNTFKCRDHDVERFLTEKAIQFHEKHLSRTYLFLSEGLSEVRAYVTLGIKCLKVPFNNQLSNRIKKNMNLHKDISQSYLIGQLGKADGVEKGMGQKLLRFSIDVFSKSFRSIGCRVIRLDCKKDLIRFYENNGFIMVSQEEDGEDLYHMIVLF